MKRSSDDLNDPATAATSDGDGQKAGLLRYFQPKVKKTTTPGKLLASFVHSLKPSHYNTVNFKLIFGIYLTSSVIYIVQALHVIVIYA
jgi:hypothetical protein